MSVHRVDPPTLGVGPSSGRRLRPRSPAELLEPSRAPERPRGRRRRKENRPLSGFIRLVSGVLTMVVIVMGLVAGGIFYLQHKFHATGPLEVSRTVAIPPGTGRRKVAEILEEQGIISSRAIFIISQLGLNVAGFDRRELKAGEYEFGKGASMAQVYNTIVAGRSVQYKLTFPEGLTSKQIVDRIAAAPDLTGDISEIPAEGSLLPDTYSFSKGMERQVLIDRMRDAQKRLLDKVWDTRQADLPIKTKEEAVILASIVEKETGKADERAEVAGVFVNRLKKGMRLQSDPTIIYGMAGGAGSLGRPIYKKDIQQKTPYNTYQIDGLPPTPIANPGRHAIEAVLNPAQTKNLYFVADGTGGHAFSETYKEHNKAVANWRKIERAARAREAAQAPAKDKTAPPVPKAAAKTGGGVDVASTDASAAAPNLVNAGASAAAAVTTPVLRNVPLPARNPR